MRLNKTTKIILILTAVFIVLPLGLIVAVTEYKAYPSDSFCREIEHLDTKEQIVARAHSQALTIMQWQDRDKIWAFRPEEPPMFRFACEVEFNNGKVARTAVVDAD